MRIIGDVHGKYERYLNAINKTDFSVQLGDFGFDYSILDNVDSNHHRIIAGNHDNYDYVGDYPHFLGNFGNVEFNGFSFFFVRGGLSVDKAIRTEGINWWREEELNYKEMNDCQIEYEKVKPNMVLSHECPLFLINQVATNSFKIENPSQTARFLEMLWKIHKPKLWVSAHHHTNKEFYICRTKFVSLGELQSIEITNSVLKSLDTLSFF